MTVHKAKGLEFPVVILADMTAQLRPARRRAISTSSAGRCAVRIAGLMPQDLVDHQDHERAREAAEGVRLAYVAATRARDLLVVPAVGDEPFEEGWVSPLNHAIYPEPLARAATPSRPRASARSPSGKTPSSNVPKATRRGRTPSALDVTGSERESRPTTSPGGIPGVSASRSKQRFGLRREELIAKDVAPAVLEEKLRAYHEWRQRRDQALIAGAEPSVVVRTAGEWAASGFGLPGGFELPPVDVLTVARDGEMPSGRRFGTLVHAILAVGISRR